MKKPTVSIVVPVFNQREYIIKALDSIFSQEVDCPFEVIVGDDCSTDGTADILKEYQSTHNYSNLYIIYREKNISKETIVNSLDLKKRSSGKYIIVLEGDDFWLDKEKIKKQISFLETHSEYIAVAHNCVVVGDNSEPNGESYQECKDEEYTFEHFASEILPGQTTTILMRNIYADKIIDMSLAEAKIRPGDRKLVFSLLCNGKIHCIQETMSAYRHIVKGGSSYSANTKYSFDNNMKLVNGYLKYAKSIMNEKAIITAEYLYLLSLREGLKKHCISFKRFLQMQSSFDHKLRLYFDLVCRDVNRFILHRYVCVRHL